MAMSASVFSFSGESETLPNGRVIVRGTRTSTGGRNKKNVFIEVECVVEEAGAVAQAIATILQRAGRINTSAF
ncbi:MAG: hypothetical protein NW223_11450 [Hyphomicrobiaceae bacterium]|nr:hypothetical protein [Hyphomicrobiaceae bacterium]